MGRKGKAFCEPPFVLHRQQSEKDKPIFDVVPLEKFLRTPHGCTDFDLILGS